MRKEMKRRARRTVINHYIMLTLTCVIAALLGAEFAGSLEFVGVPSLGVDGAYENRYSDVLSVETGGFWSVLSELTRDVDDEPAGHENSAGKSGLPENKVFGRRRGVFAKIVNVITDGIILFRIADALYMFGFTKNIVICIIVVLMLLFVATEWFLFRNVYRAVSRRIFLECRTYEKVTPQRFLFFLRTKKWLNVCFNMFMVSLFQMLWNLTLIGGIIKRYSYYLTPYISAENPEIGWRDCMALSEKIMQGHKFECFVNELSFFPWFLLGIISLGLSDTVYVNAYKTAFFAEYYAQLRQQAKETGIANSDFMKDTYLFEKCDEAKLDAAYSDIVQLQAQKDTATELGGVLGFIERNFGITLRNRDDELHFRQIREREMLIASARDAVEGKSYPDRLSSSPMYRNSIRFINMHYLRRYSVSTLLLMFFGFSFMGWLWEVSYHLLNTGVFVNRGTLHGPWLPIYGCGCVLILVVLYRLRSVPELELLSAVVLCGTLEYFTSYYLEITHGGMRWWDYSGYFLNLNGRICAEGLLAFGVGGMAVVYFLAPLFDNITRRLNRTVSAILCTVLIIAFSFDLAYTEKYPNSGDGITNTAGSSQIRVSICHDVI